MKKILLLLLCSLSALVGAAQVSVTGFSATAGSPGTVTFTVSWTPDSETGHDSVWVFVDYNTAGTMKRLPLTGAGATPGTAYRPDNSEWGAWVVAPTGTGEFSATVTLSTTTTYNYGSCAYAIPQPPKALYTAYNVITFTGTPPFELKFEGGSVSVPATTYTPPAGSIPASVTDATRAPGVITCETPTITRQPEGKAVCTGTKTRLDVSVTPVTAYRWQWYENGKVVSDGGGGATSSYITSALTATATSYSVTASIGACSVTSNTAVVKVTTTGCPAPEENCTPPEAAVNFADFQPCESAVIGTTWYLTDTREADNVQTYKVRKMPGKAAASGFGNYIWMVQDLRFGNLCPSIGATPSTTLTGVQTGKVSTTGVYYGTCTNLMCEGVPPERGTMYEWGAAINDKNALYGANTAAGCGSTAGNACQGVCPNNWHVPTVSEITWMGASMAMEPGCENNVCWVHSDWWAGVLGGNVSGGCFNFGLVDRIWTSTTYNATQAYLWESSPNKGVTANYPIYAFQGVRCIKNYN
jgi:uncharacterized protein (TIGR02145 family)